MDRRERARRSCHLNPLERLETRNLMTMAPTAQLPNMNIAIGAVVAPLNLDSYFKDPQASADFAIFNTSLGTVPVVLTPKTTPDTVANFFHNVNAGDYTNTLVERSVPGSLWEAGGQKVGADSSITANPEGSPIKREFAAPNVRGTIAMASSGSGLGSDPNRFFFNEADNSATLDSQNGGSTVFGHVVGDQGLAVMDAISAIPVPSTSPFAPPLNQAPLQYYSPGQPVQAYNLTSINNVTTASEFFSPTTDTPTVATATVQGGELTITPVSVGTAHIEVVGYGSDGLPATEDFAVNVEGWPTASGQPSNTAPQPPPNSSTLLTPVVPPSMLDPLAKGTLPNSVVAGQKTKIRQTVFLTDPVGTGPVIQNEQVTLSLSKNGTSVDDNLATASTSVNLKDGKQARLNLSINRVGATVPAGPYHLLVSVTDAEGTTTVDTGETLNVLAPQRRSIR